MNSFDLKDFVSTFAKDVVEGLQKSQKTLPSKYFYDERGSKLFEEISRLDEYYLASAEIEILQNHSGEISEIIGRNSLVIEFGSGNSTKTRILLKELHDIAGYVPVDISRDFLFREAQKLKKEFPDIEIKPVAADYTQPFDIHTNIQSKRRIIFFPGSTIGNFTPGHAKKFLCQAAGLLSKEGALLIGVDLKKDPEILKKAYNDNQAITAAFNKNLLLRVNRELHADFDVDQFRHLAVYNRERGRIEMHLESLTDQEVSVAGTKVGFKKGETIHTENSYKYTPEEFEQLISECYRLRKTWFDSNRFFGLYYFEKKQD